MPGVARLVQGVRHVLLVGGVGVAHQLVLELELVLDAVEPAGQHRGQREVGVHVAAGQAVLHPGALAVADQADRAGAVVLAPRDRGRRERAGREALVGVDVRRVQQREVVHRGEDAGDELVVERRAAPSPSQNTTSPSSPRSDRWMWQELPSRWSYFDMKVIACPRWAAISFATVL